MKNILLVGPYRPINCGLTTHIQQFESKLRKSSNVDILSLLNTESHFQVNFKSIKFYLFALKYFRDYNEVYIHFTSEYYLYSSNYLLRALNIFLGIGLFKIFKFNNVRVILHEQPTSRFYFQRVFNKFIFSGANMLIFFSGVEKNSFEALNYFKIKNSEVIPLSKFYVKYIDEGISDLRLKIKSRGENTSILFIGFIKETKGIDLVCKLLSKNDYGNLCLYIVGSAQNKNDEQFYERLIKEYSGIPSIKIFNSYVDDQEFDQWLLSVDYIIFPYKRIFNSGVLARAKLYQKKVIVSDLPGLTQLVDENDFVFKNQLELQAIITKISNRTNGN
jgi:glycosyltransferase involved in cell wall biosynthesis